MTGPATVTRAGGRFVAVVLVGLLAGTTTATTTAAAAQHGDWWRPLWGMDQVWQVTDGTGVTVAVIDSGVDASASELGGAVLPGLDIADPAGDGRTDHDREFGHGTAMAMLIAGRGDVTGLRGVAPGADILPIAHLGPTADHADISSVFTRGILFAVESGADVISISQVAFDGSPGPCPSQLADAVRYAISRDVVVVAGSGNTPSGPAAFPGSCPGVITVGAVNEHLEPWELSRRSEYVDLGAPGERVAAPTADGQVEVASGTSNSTALVSGVVALLRAHDPGASAHEVVTRLLATVQDLGEPGRDDATGYGLVRPLDALTAAVPPDAPNPVYEPLGDLTGVTPPPTAAPDRTPPGRPDVAAPVTGDGGGTGSAAPLVALAIGAALLLASLLAVVLTVRSRRR